MRRIAAVAALVVVPLAACGPKQQTCSADYENGQVLQVAQSWYLFPQLLASVDPAQYSDTQSFLDALTAPARTAGVDKYWNFMTTPEHQQQYYGAGQYVGFGFGLLIRGTQLFVAQVYAGSAAATAGFVRGDEIVAIGDPGAATVPVADILSASGGTLGDSLGPSSTAGVTKVFDVIPAGGTASVPRTVTTSLFDLSPVAFQGIVNGVGVIVLRTFVSTAETTLTNAVAAFKAAGVSQIIVDVRYNGGGLLSTAEVLANLLAGGRSATDIMYTLRDNTAHSLYDEVITFAPGTSSIQPTRIAFITSGATASASELVPNVLEPYFTTGATPDIALVGSRTYGKPVGQRAWQLANCDAVLVLVSFQLQNAQGESGYFQGLPDTSTPPAFGGPLCPAQDDLTKDLGDPAEASTAAALYWLANGSCPAAPAAAQALRAAPSPDRYPVPPHPSIAQVDMPGLF